MNRAWNLGLIVIATTAFGLAGCAVQTSTADEERQTTEAEQLQGSPNQLGGAGEGSATTAPPGLRETIVLPNGTTVSGPQPEPWFFTGQPAEDDGTNTGTTAAHGADARDPSHEIDPKVHSER